MVQVVYRTRERCQMKHSVHGARHLKRLAHIVLEKFKALPIKQMLDILAMPGDEIINGDNLVTAL